MVNDLEKKLNAYFKNLVSCHSDVGFIDGSKTYEDGMNVPTVAYNQENGVRRWKDKTGKEWFIPPRPFMSYSSRLFESGFSNILAKEIVGKYDSKDALETASKKLQERIQLSIIEWTTPKNAEYTIEKKGFDDPLIETGLMFDSVEYQVKSGNME